MWVVKCLSLPMRVWVACQLSAEREPTVQSSSLRLVQRLLVVAQPRGGRRKEEQDVLYEEEMERRKRGRHGKKRGTTMQEVLEWEV